MKLSKLPLWLKIVLTVFVIVFFEPYGIVLALAMWGLILYDMKRVKQMKPKYSSAILLPMLAHYMFVQNGHASDVAEGLNRLNTIDIADIRQNMSRMLQDQSFMSSVLENNSFMDSLWIHTNNLQEHVTDPLLFDDLSKIAADEALKAVTPVEHGGYNMEYGNTFNDIGAGGLQDFHHVTDFDHFSNNHNHFHGNDNFHNHDFHNQNTFNNHHHSGGGMF
ncbi:MAG: hypothetical protein GX351_10175 [Peptococcaceae bacterium]|nr:hypothetical protein [Peptococcaceae bacterium]